jgi:voltage-gated potassium channel
VRRARRIKVSVDERSLRIERRFEWPMVIAALLVIPLLVIEDSGLDGPWYAIGVVLNWGTWLAFAVELVVMVVVTPRPREWVGRHPLDVAVVFLTLPFLPSSLAWVRLLRLLRLGRLFTLRNLLSLDGVRYAALTALLTVLIGGALFAAVEEGQDLSSWDGIWWAVTTVTTVGYGDISPTTDGGRVLAIAIMCVGIGFVALVTAYVADRFIRRDVVEEVEESEDAILAELRLINERLERLEKRTPGPADPRPG